ncbi:MAG: class I SAM-dependent methyltransferase [Deltaproteobacteria bacterium]
MKDHWENVYASRDINRLGWYEKVPEPSIRLMSRCLLDKDDAVLDVGAGTSAFIDYLLESGYENVIAVDISQTALNKLMERLGKEKSRLVEWIVDDITRPTHMKNLKNIALWHDRALLHFLLEEKEREMYLTVLKKVVKRGGYVIIASFSPIGARKCSGLNIMNYDQAMLSDFLGEGFDLIEHFDHTYYTPSGEERPYIYILFKRTNR